MGGIAVAVALGGQAAPDALVQRMLAAIAHRGERPATWSGDGAMLGAVHRATTPEAEREQLPLVGADGRFALVWDGRLDNRDELEAALHLGGGDTAPTDADYVLAAYGRWGDGCAERLLGDWALAVWDCERRRLFCAKDPLGWRPLFFLEAGGMLLAGSEPLQVFAGAGAIPLANRDYLARYLAGALQEPGATCYEGLRELGGGERLVVDDAGARPERYWRPPPPHDLGFRRFEEYVDEFEAVFRQATRARTRSNGPVAVALSGGLDSSYVAAAAAGETSGLRAITLFAPDAGLDERVYARAVAQPLQLPHVEVDADDCWGFSSRWLPDGTYDDLGALLPGALSRRLGEAAHEQGCATVLTGDGGDEWMDGDVRFVAAALFARRPRDAWRLAKASRPNGAAWRTLLNAIVAGVAPRRGAALARALRGRRGAAKFAPVVDIDPRWRSPRDIGRTRIDQRRQAHEAVWTELAEVTRVKAAWRDRHAFAPLGVELRTPFHDLRVVELMAAMPDWIKRYRAHDREVLRAAGERMLPGRVFQRSDKARFDELVMSGLVRERDRIEASIARVCLVPDVRVDVVGPMVEDSAESGATRADHALLRLITAGLWLQELDRFSGLSTEPVHIRARYMRRSEGGGREEVVRGTGTAGAR